MKNKKTVYILLPIVLLIWGAVMYQFFSFSTTEESQTTTSDVFILKPITIKERDTAAINVNYRDPFLGKMYSEKGDGAVFKKKTTKLKKAPKIVEPIVWPTIDYKGIVSDTKDKNKVFMIIINGQTFLMRKGETENEILLKEGDRESVYVKYKGNLNIILLQE
jgi:hypothetical protein